MKYLFLDIDGTLYSSEIGKAPDSAVEAIALARKNGHKVFLCTGRALAECKPYLGYDVDGFVFASGSMIYVDGKRIYDHPYPKEDVVTLQNAVKKYDIGCTYEGACGAYCNEKGYEFALLYYTGEDTDPEVIEQRARDNAFFEEEHWHKEDEKIYKACMYTPTGMELAGLKSDLPHGYVMTCTAKDFEGYSIFELTNQNITKATGIEKVLNHYGASVSDAVGIGDSMNDVPMLRYCGTAIAMGNAFDELKKEADFVTTHILDDGIMNAFKHLKVID